MYIIPVKSDGICGVLLETFSAGRSELWVCDFLGFPCVAGHQSRRSPSTTIASHGICCFSSISKNSFPFELLLSDRTLIKTLAHFSPSSYSTSETCYSKLILSGLRQQSFPPVCHHRDSEHHTWWSHCYHGRRSSSRRSPCYTSSSLQFRQRGHAHIDKYREMYCDINGKCYQAAVPDKPRSGTLLPDEDWG